MISESYFQSNPNLSHGFFKRINSDHPLELYLGFDNKNRMAFELRENFIPRDIKGTSSIEITQFENDKYNTIRFSLVDEEIKEQFYVFCDDLINYTKNAIAGSGYSSVVQRFSQWKHLFFLKGSRCLSENQVLGLIGELTYLQNVLFKNFSQSDAILSWVGPNLAHKDFSYDSKWIEIKSVHKKDSSVHISSLEQLQTSKNEQGFLVIYTFEKMSPKFDGISINKLVTSILKEIEYPDDKANFISKLQSVGYEYNKVYDQYVFNQISVNTYKIEEGFPSLTIETVPKGILKADYDISMLELSKYEIKGKE